MQFPEEKAKLFTEIGFNYNPYPEPVAEHLLFKLVNSTNCIQAKYEQQSKGLLQYLALILLINANDIEINPGPPMNTTTNKDRQYLCGTCDESVNWSQKGIICETCDQWYHANCQGVHTASYHDLNETNLSWHCLICNAPNYSDTVHDLHSNIVTNSDSIHSLSDLSNCSEADTTSRRKPLHTSTPIRKQAQRKTNSPLRILNINCQSIKLKLCRLENVIESIKPDIIICTETIMARHEY